MSSLDKKFLDHLIENNTPATVFLTNGVKLSGSIIAVDDEMSEFLGNGQPSGLADSWQSLLLTRDGITQLVFRHAIATVMPQDSIDVQEFLKQS